MSAKRKPKVDAGPIRIDIGCGKNKKEGFIGLDQFPIPGVDVVTDLTKRWPYEDNSVDEANCSHFIEHLTNFNGKWERVKFFNELHRVLKPGAKCALAFPHWASNRFYGDPTHKEPFSEMGFYYLNKEWRLQQTPGVDISYNPDGYSCDFDFTYGYAMNPSITAFNEARQQYAMANYKEAITDIVATITKK